MSQRGKGRLSERHPHEKFNPAHLPPGKAGRTWLAVRFCSRCLSRFPHPLAPGWRVACSPEGTQLWVCPGCAEPDDPDPDGRTDDG